MVKRLTVSALLLLFGASVGVFVWSPASVPPSTWPAVARSWPPTDWPVPRVPPPPPPPGPSACACNDDCGWEGEWDGNRGEEEPTPGVRLELTEAAAGEAATELQAKAEPLSPE